MYPSIPDFTTAFWQTKRNEPKLLARILDGKGKEMPAFRGKLKEDQARGLVAHIRSFATTTGKPGAQKEREPGSPGDFEMEFRRLLMELDELKKQFRQASKVSTDEKSSKSSRYSYSRDAAPAERSMSRQCSYWSPASSVARRSSVSIISPGRHEQPLAFDQPRDFLGCAWIRLGVDSLAHPASIRLSSGRTLSCGSGGWLPGGVG
jgi:hypothetical protein